MTEVNQEPPALADPVQTSITALEARVTELETVVHTFVTAAAAQGASAAHHGVVVTWLEKVGARIKAAVEEIV